MTAQTTPTTNEFTVTENGEILHITHNDTGLEFVAVPYEDRTDEGELITEWYETTLTENGKVWATKLDIELVYDVIRDYVERMAIANAPVIELDMANIANLFFAIELSRTVFNNVHNEDIVEWFQDWDRTRILRIISDEWSIVKKGTDEPRFEIINTITPDYANEAMRGQNIRNYANELKRGWRIIQDLYDYGEFSAPYFTVQYNVNDCPF